MRESERIISYLSIIIQWNPSIPDTLGPAHSVLIKGGVLISGVVSYTSLCSYSALIKGDVLISGCPYRGVPLYKLHYKHTQYKHSCISFLGINFTYMYTT